MSAPTAMRVLALGTNRMCFDRLRALEHEIVLLIPKGRARPDDISGPYRDLVVLDDRTPDAGWVAVARALHGIVAFDVVVAYNEHTYAQVDAISAALDIPSVVDVGLYRRVKDKFATRQALTAAAIPNCRYEIAHDVGQLPDAVAAIGWPCIVKPVDGEASRGVTKVGSDADLAAAITALGDVGSGVLVEEFLVGPEFSVEAISIGHSHHVVAVTKKFIDPRTFVECGHVVPAPLDDSARTDIETYVIRVLDALGFHDCPSHTEIVLTDDGPRLIETHNRVAGDSILDIARLATGIDLYDLTVAQSIGEPVTVTTPGASHGAAAVWFAAPSGAGAEVLSEVRNLEVARQLPGVDRLQLTRQVGSRKVQVRQSDDRSGYAIATGQTAEDAVRNARSAIEALEFVYSGQPSTE
jgi:biotin carboxylase